MAWCTNITAIKVPVGDKFSYAIPYILYKCGKNGFCWERFNNKKVLSLDEEMNNLTFVAHECDTNLSPFVKWIEKVADLKGLEGKIIGITSTNNEWSHFNFESAFVIVKNGELITRKNEEYTYEMFLKGYAGKKDFLKSICTKVEPELYARIAENILN